MAKRLVFFLLLSSAFGVFASSFTVDNFSYYSSSDITWGMSSVTSYYGTAEAYVSGYTGDGIDIKIPDYVRQTVNHWADGKWYSSYVDYKVTAVGSGAFRNNDKLMYVSLPATVKKIGESAFYGCAKLKNVSFWSVTNIGYYAFYNTGIEHVTLPSTLIQLGNSSGYSPFGKCNNLKSVVVNGPAELPNYLFDGCQNLESCEFGEKITSIGTCSFRGTKIKSLTLPINCKTIYGYCFADCTNLETCVLNEGMVTIANHAFSGCAKLTMPNIPATVTTIGEAAFYSVGNDPSVPFFSLTIPQTVKNIGGSSYGKNGAFGNMLHVTNLVVQGIQCAEGSYFINMTNLISITFGPGVQKIGDSFNTLGYSYSLNAQNLRRVFCASDDLIEIGDQAFGLYGPVLRNQTRMEEVVLPNTLQIIGDWAFAHCGATNIHVDSTSFTLPKTISRLGSYAFAYSNIKAFSAESGFSVFGYSAFANCTNLTDAIIPSSINQYESFADVNSYSSSLYTDVFFGCAALTNIVVASGLSTLGSRMFGSCQSIQKFYIPASVINIGDSLCSNCIGLEEVEISDGVPAVSDSMFIGCTALKDVRIPSSVKKINSSAFQNCSALQRITIPTGTHKIGAKAFNGCISLTSLTLNEGLQAIDESAFGGCVGLRKLSIPDSLCNIGNTAFSGCTSLSTVSLPACVETVGAGAFSGCSVKSLLFNNANGELIDQFSKESLRTLFLGKDAAGISGELLADCSALETVITASANTNYCTFGGVLYDKSKTKLIKYPCASTATDYTAPASVIDIDESAFAYSSSLSELNFTGNINTIGEGAFDWCLGLQSVNFGGSVGTIGNGAFSVCPSLETLSFTGNSPTWGSNQFWYSTPTIFVESGTAGWNTAANSVGFDVFYSGNSGTVVPDSWLEQYPSLIASSGGNYEKAVHSTGANGLTLHESYVAGLDPTNENSKFTVVLTMENGEPKITWSPDLSADAAPRTYTTYGKSTLDAHEEWQVVTSENKSLLKFFRVAVELE